MTNDEVFDVWAPPNAIWSPWCKPVLFAHMSDDDDDEPPPLAERRGEMIVDFPGAPAPGERVAVVVDLAEATSVNFGLAFAERFHYRPVPLFNGAPTPIRGQAVQVEVDTILAALWHGTERLRTITLEPDAPPIFLLDCNRRIARGSDLPEIFDNRSVSFPTDFPSANRLIASGIRRALVIQAKAGAMEADLAHTLRRWQEAGIAITLKALESDDGAKPIDVPKPSSFRSVLHRVLELAGLRRNVLGGFGGFPPQLGGAFGAGG